MLNFFYFVTIALLSSGQFSNVFKNSGINIYLFDLWIGFLGISIIIFTVLTKKRLYFPKYLILFLLLILFCFVSLLVSGYKRSLLENLTSALYIIRFISYFIFGLATYSLIKLKLISGEVIKQWLIFSGIFIALAGFVQLILLPDFTTLDESLGWDPHKNRLASTFFDPNFIGAYLVMCITLLLDTFYKKSNQKDIAKEGNKFYRSFLIIFIIALILTFSRSSWLMMGIVILIYGVLRSPKLILISILIMFLSYFAVPRIQTRVSGITDPADSARFRVISWSNTVEIIKDNWLFGVGFNALRYVQRDYGYVLADDIYSHSASGSDSSILFIFATTGIFGLLTFLIAYFYPVFDCFFKKNNKNVLIISIMLSLIVESQFINSLFYPQILFFWLTVLAIES